MITRWFFLLSEETVTPEPTPTTYVVNDGYAIVQRRRNYKRTRVARPRRRS